jgi:hypothetical protein
MSPRMGGERAGQTKPWAPPRGRASPWTRPMHVGRQRSWMAPNDRPRAIRGGTAGVAATWVTVVLRVAVLAVRQGDVERAWPLAELSLALVRQMAHLRQRHATCLAVACAGGGCRPQRVPARDVRSTLLTQRSRWVTWQFDPERTRASALTPAACLSSMPAVRGAGVLLRTRGR